MKTTLGPMKANGKSDGGPRLMTHTPTGNVVLVFGRSEIKFAIGVFPRVDWNWNYATPANYQPFKGTVTLENE